MLTPPVHSQNGFNLIELVIGIAIVAVLFALGLPSFSEWTTNSKIRTWAESIQSGLQLARTQALTRNTRMRFQLVDTLTATCQLSANGTNWVVSRDDVSAQCNAAPDTSADPDVPPAAPVLIQSSPATAASTLAVTASDPFVCFTGLGRVDTQGCVATNPAIKIDVKSSATNTACVANGGTVRCLRVCAQGGTIKMCDPGVSDTNDPRYCNPAIDKC